MTEKHYIAVYACKTNKNTLLIELEGTEISTYLMIKIVNKT